MADSCQSSRLIPPHPARRDGKNRRNPPRLPILPVIPAWKHIHVRARIVSFFSNRDKWDKWEEWRFSAAEIHPGCVEVPG